MKVGKAVMSKQTCHYQPTGRLDQVAELRVPFHDQRCVVQGLPKQRQ